VGGPKYMTELGFRCGPVRRDIEGEGQLQQLLTLVPVDAVGEVDGASTAGKADLLLDGRVAERAHDPDARLIRSSYFQRDRLRDIQIHHIAEIMSIDIPGVPVVRYVPVQLEQVAGRPGWQHLTTAGHVHQRRDQAAAIDRQPDKAVVQQDLSTVLDRPHGRGCWVRNLFTRSESRNTRPLERTCVEGDLPVTITGQQPLAVQDKSFESCPDLRVGALGLAVHPGDRASRQYVVKLLEKDDAPESLQLLVGVVSGQRDCGGRRPQFRFP